jgi:hypothetical protein
VKVGITLPQFVDDGGLALNAAHRAESLGIDGVFCFDHLWPMGQPGRPALSSGPLLGALTASTSVRTVGSLVARIGLLPDDALVAELTSLSTWSGSRFIAGIGTGDHLSRKENEAFGIPFEPAEVRLSRVASVAAILRDRGIPVWIGGVHPDTTDIAARQSVGANLWEGDLDRVAELAGSGVEVTWGGPVGEMAAEAVARLSALAGAGATWAVCAWPRSLEVVAEAAEAVRSAG